MYNIFSKSIHSIYMRKDENTKLAHSFYTESPSASSSIPASTVASTSTVASALTVASESISGRAGDTMIGVAGLDDRLIAGADAVISGSSVGIPYEDIVGEAIVSAAGIVTDADISATGIVTDISAAGMPAETDRRVSAATDILISTSTSGCSRSTSAELVGGTSKSSVE
jgi:hypothetical protein